MTTPHFISLLFMTAFYLFAGISHFWKPGFFFKIMPRWVPYPEKVNLMVGGVEVILALGLLFSDIRTYAVWGIIAMLVAVFPANIHHFQLARKKGKHVMATLIRLPIQGILIYWAYTFI